MILTLRRHYKKKPQKPLQGVAVDLSIRITPDGEYVLTDVIAKPRPVSEKFPNLAGILECIEDNLEKLEV